ncbi:MAG TPA: hypothetical protein VFP37_17495 [Steroidobacteraceae bacterium]|nr:hypothetical protein [Steroidobacteraceae bacterium]
MKRASLVILLGSLLVASASQATTYVRIEKDGSKTYSDRPLPGGHPVEIEPAQTYSAPPSAPAVDRSRSPEEQAALDAARFEYACALSPRNDQTFQNPETVTISVQLTPSLRPGDRVDISLDGTRLDNSANATSVTLPYPDRGTHTASVQIVDRTGKTVCSLTSAFHVLRAGLNSPARQPARPPPRPAPSRPRPN